MIHQLARRLLPRTLRNWIRSPSSSVSYIKNRLAFVSGAHEKVSPAEGWMVACHPAAKHYFEVFKDDPEQAEELETFITHCGPEMRLLDVGAHYGFFALACQKYAGPESKVLCVEASPKAAAILRANLVLNGADSQVTVVNCAMGDKDGQLEMLSTGPLGGDYFVSPDGGRTDTVSVPQRTMDSLLEETGFQPTHVKMDIESFEYEAIQSGSQFLKRHRPTLFLEVHGTMLRNRGKDPADVFHMLAEAGYAAWIVGGRQLQLQDLAAVGFDCRIIARPV